MDQEFEENSELDASPELLSSFGDFETAALPRRHKSWFPLLFTALGAILLLWYSLPEIPFDIQARNLAVLPKSDQSDLEVQASTPVAKVSPQSSSNFDISKVTLGIHTIDVQEAYHNLPKSAPKFGVVVTDVLIQGPGGELRLNDVITHVDSIPIKNQSEFNDFLKTAQAGKTCRFYVRRFYAKPHSSSKWNSINIDIHPTSLAQMAFSVLKKETDKVMGLTYYTHADVSAKTDRTTAYLYVVRDENRKNLLYLRLQYYGRGWLFTDSFRFLIGDQRFHLLPKHGQVKRIAVPRGACEWCDFLVEGEVAEIVSCLSKAEHVDSIIRFESDKEKFDYQVPKSEIDQIAAKLISADVYFP